MARSLETISSGWTHFAFVSDVVPRVARRTPGEALLSKQVLCWIVKEALCAKSRIMFAACARGVTIVTSISF